MIWFQIGSKKKGNCGWLFGIYVMKYLIPNRIKNHKIFYFLTDYINNWWNIYSGRVSPAGEGMIHSDNDLVAVMDFNTDDASITSVNEAAAAVDYQHDNDDYMKESFSILSLVSNEGMKIIS